MIRESSNSPLHCSLPSQRARGQIQRGKIRMFKAHTLRTVNYQTTADLPSRPELQWGLHTRTGFASGCFQRLYDCWRNVHKSTSGAILHVFSTFLIRHFDITFEMLTNSWHKVRSEKSSLLPAVDTPLPLVVAIQLPSLFSRRESLSSVFIMVRWFSIFHSPIDRPTSVINA